MRTRGTYLAPVLAVTALACSPGPSGSDKVIARDSAGVSIVANTGADRPLGSFLLHIVDLEPPDSSLTPVPWGVAADPERGRIYAIDWTSPRVVVFKHDGEYEGEYGREGSGPGEFRNPVALALEDDGTLAVWDAGRAMISRWSPDGSLLDEERTPADYWGPGFGIAGGALLTVTTEELPNDLAMVQRLVAVSSGATRTIYELPIELSMMDLPGYRMPAQRIFAPSIVWTTGGDGVYVLSGPQYRVDRYDQGGLVASYRRDIDPIPVTEGMAVASLLNGSGPYGGFLRRLSITPVQLVRAVGHEPLVSPVQNVALDPSGRLWVSRTTDGVLPSAADILSVDGAYVGTLATPGIPSAFVSDSIVVVLRVEKTGRTVLGLYRIAKEPRDEPGDSPTVAMKEFRDCPHCPLMVEVDNVYEWVADCWHPTHEGQPGDGSARIEDSPWWKGDECERPAMRSASWRAFPWVVRPAYRGSWRPGPWSDREPTYGFRVVRTMTPGPSSRRPAGEVAQ